MPAWLWWRPAQVVIGPVFRVAIFRTCRPVTRCVDALRALMTGAGDTSQVPPFLRVMAKLGKLSGITKGPAVIRTVTRKFLPMGNNVVVIGGSLVGLELSEFLAERGRNVTLVEEGQQLACVCGGRCLALLPQIPEDEHTLLPSLPGVCVENFSIVQRRRDGNDHLRRHTYGLAGAGTGLTADCDSDRYC